MSKLEITKKVTVPVRFPDIAVSDAGVDKDGEEVCLLAEKAILEYNCADIPCRECYFCVLVYEELNDVSDQ